MKGADRNWSTALMATDENQQDLEEEEEEEEEEETCEDVAGLRVQLSGQTARNETNGPSFMLSYRIGCLDQHTRL